MNKIPTLGSRGLRRTSAILTTAAMLIALVAIVLAAPVQAATPPQVGPLDWRTGFPLYVADSNGLKLGMCLDDEAQCLTFNPDLVAGTGFPTVLDSDEGTSNFSFAPSVADPTVIEPVPEAFWWASDARIDGPAGQRMRLVLSTEAAFGGLTAVAGDQVAFGRVRVVLTGMTPDATYHVVHPYGADDFTANANGVVRATVDVGCFNQPCDYSQVTNSPILTTGFLTQDPLPANPKFIADFATPSPVTGGVNDVFSVSGPGLDSGTQTNLFNTSGEIYQQAPGGRLAFDKNYQDFGKGSIGAPVTGTTTVTNFGDAPVAISGLSFAGASAADFAVAPSSTCTTSTTLAADASCTVDMTYTASAIGAQRARLVVTSDAANADAGQVRLHLKGTGRDPNVADPQVGPIDPLKGFPFWYSDQTVTGPEGTTAPVKLEMCLGKGDLGPTGNPAGQCLGAPTDPNAPVTVLDNAAASNFDPGGEAFYWSADSKMLSKNGEVPGFADADLRLILGQEGSFATGAVKRTDQIAFGRVRTKLTGVQPNSTYTVTYPFGTLTVPTDDRGNSGNVGTDIGCLGSPCDFRETFKSQITNFLQWDTVADRAPGHISDFNVEHAITGSPLGTNVFKVEGPGLPDGGVTKSLFSASGRLWNPAADTPLIGIKSIGTAAAVAAGTAPVESFAHFPTTQVGTIAPVDQVMQLTNAGTGSLSIGTLGFNGPNADSFQVTSTTCGTALAADATCDVTVSFFPQAAGNLAANLTVTSDAANQQPNPAGGVWSEIPVRGVGFGTAPAPLPVLDVTPASLDLGNQQVGTTSAAQNVTVRNAGGGTLTVASAVLSGTDNADFGIVNNCATGLGHLQSCTIGVTFSPATTGLKSATLTVTDGDGAVQTVALSGTGTATPPGPAVASVSPTSLDFGSQNLGTTSAPQAVTVTNTGESLLTVGTIAITGDFAQTNNCTTVAPGASCTINVTFTPTEPAALPGTLTIPHNAAGSPATVSLAGTGTGPVASITPASLTFGNQAVGTTSASQSVTVRNTGNSPLSVTAVAATGDFAQTNNCTTVAAAGSCTVNVTFTPTAANLRTGTLSITHNAAGSPATVTLSGTGTAAGAPVLTPAKTLVDFGRVRVARTKTVALKVTNTGTAPLTVTSVTTDNAQFTATRGNCVSVAPRKTCNLSLTFAPTAPPGLKTATLQIVSNAPPVAVRLTGTGT